MGGVGLIAQSFHMASSLGMRRDGPSPFVQGVVGAAACGAAAIPLAIVLSLITGIWGDAVELRGIVLGFVLYVVFGTLIGLAMGFLVALPLYLLLTRMNALRLDIFTLLGAVGGFGVFSLWIGAENVRDAWPYALGFVVCGVISSLAFWLGAKKANS